MLCANGSGTAAISCAAAVRCRRPVITRIADRPSIAGATTSDRSGKDYRMGIWKAAAASSQWRHTIAHPILLNRQQMNKSIAALALIALCSTAQASPASDADNGFLTGNYFRGGSQSMRAAYVIGILDGFSYSTVFGAPDARVEKLRRCIGAMNANTRAVGTIVDQYLDAHPESWNEKMQPIVLRAMRQACATHGVAID